MFVMNLFEIVCHAPHDNELVVLEKEWRGDIVNSLADISRLKIVLDLGPSSDIEPCLKQKFKH